MGIIQRAALDITRITSNLNGFGVPIQFVHPSGFVANVVGMHTEIWYDVDTEGNIVYTKLANVAVSNQTLINAGYSFRDSNGVVTFNKHLVNVQNISGNTLNYNCKTWHPDEQTGLILIFLNAYKP